MNLLMTWFYNNDGVADGPHDEPAMRAFIQQGRITARTLVWKEGLPLWQEARQLQAAWWEPAEKPAAKGPAASSPEAGGTPARRLATPMAPSEAEAPKPKAGFLKRLFGRKDK